MMRSEIPTPRQNKLARPLRLASFCLALLCLAVAPQAWAGSVGAIASASVTILEPGGLYAPAGFSFDLPAAPATSRAMVSAAPSGNTQLTISGQVGDTLSIVAPNSMTLVRDGGGETLIASMSATSADGFRGQDLMASGSVMRAGSMKVEIGCDLAQVTGDAPSGAYQGQFTVLIQYN